MKVDLHELIEKRRVDFPDRTQKAEVPTLGGQVANELDLAITILLAKRPYEYMTAIVQGFNPVRFGICAGSGNRQSWITGQGHGDNPMEEKVVSDLRPWPGGDLTRINFDVDCAYLPTAGSKVLCRSPSIPS
ncbi:hypothetical protein FQZ97_1164220 [compost metagenome]